MKNVYKFKTSFILLFLLLAGVSIYASVPTGTTDAASSIAAGTAVLNGSINPNGEVTTVYFEYGTTTAYGSTAYVPGTITGSLLLPVTIEILGLTHLQGYHFRVIAVNASGTFTGSDVTFTTISGVTTENVYNIASTSATIRYTVTGSMDGRGYWIGTGSATPEQNANGRVPAGADSLTISGTATKIISGLTSSTVYKVCGYRLSGGVYLDGEIISFVPGASAPVTYNCYVTEDVQISPSAYQFEVYIQRTGDAPLYLNNYQLGFETLNVNTELNDYMTGEYVPNSCQISGLTPAGMTIALQVAGGGHPYNHIDVRINGLPPNSTGTLIGTSPVRIGQFIIRNWTSAAHTTSRAFGKVPLDLGWDDDFIARTYIYAMVPDLITGTRTLITHLAGQHTINTKNPAMNSLNWKGTLGTTWSDPGNWLASPTSITAPPSASDNAYIASTGVTNNPTISGSTAYECDTLTINSGRVLSIASDGGLKVNGALTNNAGTGGLVIQSGATGSGSLLHNTNDVNATIQRYVDGNRYHTVSVPLTSAASPTSNLFLGSYLYYFDETQTTPVDNGWVNMGTSTTNPLTTTRGYMVYYVGSNTTYSFSGPMNNGSINATASYTAGAPAVNKGFNLVPNPYPSAIDWAASTGWTKTGINDATWIWNPTAGNYSTYGSQVGTVNGTRYIPVGQSFFVQATGAPTLTMDNNVRVHNATNFYKAAGSFANLLRLKAEANNYFDEIIVRFQLGGSTAFETSGDVQKMFGNEDAPQLCSLSSDDILLSINSLPEVGGEITIPLNFSIGISTDVTFTASGMESFTNNGSIFLEDQALNKMINLRTNPVYTFNYQAGSAEDRFLLHFSGVNGINDPSATAGKAFVSNGNIFIEVPGMAGKEATVSVYNSLGQVVSTDRRMMNGIVTVNAPDNSGVYVLQVSTTEQHFVTKVFNK